MKHTVTLRNGVQVPALGLGTWFLGENKAARAREMESLRTGISAGMTLIDTAEMYGNGKAESLIKEVISDKKRDDLFLVSKVLPNKTSRCDPADIFIGHQLYFAIFESYHFRRNLTVLSFIVDHNNITNTGSASGSFH